jgi:glycosyltransferase involved in cell wall biosynthesis
MVLKKRLHVLALPHTLTRREAPWSACAFTQKVVKWTGMMKSLGHEVILYGTDEASNEAECDEFVSCISEEDRARWFNPPFPEEIPMFTIDHPGFAIFNQTASQAIRDRKQEGDYICQVGGQAQEPVSVHNGDLTTIEFGVGYSGIFSDHRVFESYAWMHAMYTLYYAQDSGGVPDGDVLDTVIPNYWDVKDFPAGDGDGGYVLYIGRHIMRKGIHLAAGAARRAGKRLIIAGAMGDQHPEYGEYVGIVGPEERAELMRNAEAVLAPTIYIGPFEGVTVEANLCGTPVVTTDWGVFTETVRNGDNGWRCRDGGEMVWALNNIGELNRKKIRRDARKLYSTETIKHQYQSYFERIEELHEHGIWVPRERRPGR